MKSRDLVRICMLAQTAMLLLSTGALQAQRGGAAPQGPPPAPEPLRWEYIGPGNAGRVSAVAGIPGDTLTYYLSLIHI